MFILSVYSYTSNDTGKRKVVPVHTMQAFRNSRGVAALILNLDTRRR
jgi:hypothetical protein